MLAFPPARAVWITRPLLNADELAEWAQVEGFDDLVPSVWHVSVIKADPEAKLDLSPLTVEPSEDRTVLRLGDLIALGFNSSGLAEHHAAHRSAGGWWQHDGYRPHVSFTPDDRRDLQGVRPFTGALRFGPETVDDWGGGF